MPPLISEEEMNSMSSGDEYDAEDMSTDMLEDIRDGCQSHPTINRREARYNIRDCIKKSQAEWKGALLSTLNMDKGLHKSFKAVVNKFLQVLPILGESVIFHSRAYKLCRSDHIVRSNKETMDKTTLEDIKDLTDNENVLVQYPEKGEPVTLFMDVYKAKIQSDESLDKLKLRIVVIGDLQNKKLVGYTWSPTASMRNLK